MTKLYAACLVLLAMQCVSCSAPADVKKEPQPPTAQQLEAVFKKKMACKREEDGVRDSLGQMENLYRVFYSPKLDSCVTAIYTLYPKNKGSVEDWQETAELNDFLSHKQLWFKSYPKSVLYPEVEEDLDNTIKTLGFE